MSGSGVTAGAAAAAPGALRREVAPVLLIVGLALLVRVLFAWPALTGVWGFRIGDDDDYHALAVSLVEQGRLAINGVATAYRMPGLPLFLALWYALAGASPQIGYAALVALSALTCAGVYLLGRDLGGPSVGLAAGLVTALNPALVVYSSLLMTETLMAALVLGAMLALARLRERLDMRWALLAGLLLGAATLTRANFGPFVAVALAWLAYERRDRLTAVVRCAVVAGAVAGALWGGWVARNAVVFGAFIPFTTQGGYGYHGIYNDLSAEPPVFGGFGVWGIVEPPAGAAGANEVEESRLHTEAARAWIAANPGTAMAIALMQAVHLWSPPLDLGSHVVLAGLALAGLVIARRRGARTMVPWVLLAGVMTAMAVATLAVPRFQLVLHPGMAALAGLALVAAYDRLAASRRGGRAGGG